jgi:hypothetical protein
VGAAGAIAATVIGVAFLDSRDAFVEGGRSDPEQRDDAIALRTGANIAGFSALALGVLGSTLLILAPADEAPSTGTGTATGSSAPAVAETELRVGPAGASLRVAW